jgi:VIT1/CCC1 family predicted Fe2+/Mn2+ transporter
VLVIPFAIVAFAAVLAASIIGGYLSVARVAGSAWMKRRRGDHGQNATGLLRSTAWGLAIVLAVWIPAVLLSPVPAAGDALVWLAVAVTWALATTGFGAAILTRGGVRTTFGRRFQPPELPAATLYEEPEPEISTGEWLSGRTK